MVNVPAVGLEWDWNLQRGVYRDRVLQALAERGFDVSEGIEEEHILTPLDHAQLSGAWAGALYGASSNDRWAAFRRPHNRARFPRGLYFAGGTAHPGGGLGMVALSGKAASRMILDDLPAG
jgi:phytoene desaturase